MRLLGALFVVVALAWLIRRARKRRRVAGWRRVTGRVVAGGRGVTVAFEVPGEGMRNMTLPPDDQGSGPAPGSVVDLAYDPADRTAAVPVPPRLNDVAEVAATAALAAFGLWLLV